jgi:hypothetical protein
LVPIYRPGAQDRSFAVHHDHHNHTRPADGSRVWRSEDGLHVDVRGLDEPLTTILRTIESGEASSAIIGHFDSEPIMLYPELEERGWTHEAMDVQCGDCEGGFMVRRG